uniref:Uncharacterized protein n=1 Tax=viral metagenome TaxID=1070528 RepID=A0A6M3ME60_9ZZZZ
MAELRKYGVQADVYFPLIDRGAVDFEATPVTFAAGDTKVSKDGAAFANTTNDPSHIAGGIYKLTLTATEMQAALIVVTLIDSATKTWEDQALMIDTYGNASAQHAFDLDTAAATMRGTDNAALASVCTETRLAELDAANLPADIAAIPTTPMRGTDNAALASVATEARLAELDAANIPADINNIQTRITDVFVKGTADSGTTTTIVDAARTEADVDYWKGSWIRFTSGTISGQTRLITAFNPTTDTITFAPALTVVAATHTYEIIAAANIDLVNTTTTNTDMRGTDSAALASVCTEARLAELDAANIPADIDAIPTTAMRGTDNAALASVCTEARLAELGATNLPADIDAILVDTSTTLETHLTDLKGATFSSATDSNEAIRDRGDAAWTTGAGGSDRLLMVDTTIATLASQTSFTLTAGSADDDAYNNCTIVIEDVSTATQKAVGLISDYTGATKTVTLKYDPGIFTMAATDKVYILAENALKATLANRQLNVAADGDIAGNVDGSVASLVGHTAQTGDSFAVVNHANHGNAQLVRSTPPANKLDVSATGEAGLDFDNVKQATGATTLTNITVPTVTIVGTTTTNTDMRGTDSAALASVCTEARLAELDAANVPADIDTLKTRVPDTISLANINAEVDTALNTAIPAIPTADSINERVKTIDDKLPTNYIMGSTVLTAKDDEIDAIKAKTDNLPALPAATGDIPSAATVADAVWDEAQSGHVSAGTFGKYLDTEVSGVGGGTAAAIADAVWDEVQADHTAAGTTGESLNDAGGGASPSTIADAVWDEDATTHSVANSYGRRLNRIHKEALSGFAPTMISGGGTPSFSPEEKEKLLEMLGAIQKLLLATPETQKSLISLSERIEELKKSSEVVNRESSTNLNETLSSLIQNLFKKSTSLLLANNLDSDLKLTDQIKTETNTLAEDFKNQFKKQAELTVQVYAKLFKHSDIIAKEVEAIKGKESDFPQLVNEVELHLKEEISKILAPITQAFVKNLPTKKLQEMLNG